MTAQPLSRRTAAMLAASGRFVQFFEGSTWARRVGTPGISDMVVGNPQDMPLPGFVSALQRWSVPQDKAWFAYTNSHPEARATVARVLCERRGVPFEADDITMTNGAFGGLAIALGAIVDPGDEVIFTPPPWFFYETLILWSGATPVRVPVQQETWDLDVDAIAAAISPRTRAILVNSPNNPTGRIYPPSTLERLATVLGEASARNGRPIYLLSDEAYSRIVFDGQPFYSPTAYYANAFLIYTYGKTLLTPGERLGYIALPPTMPDRESVRQGVFASQIASGYLVANTLLQHALGELETLSIDVAHLQQRRDQLVAALRAIGYEVNMPQGTFYLLARSPWADDVAFCEALAERDVFVLPGAHFELPGYFRISLTATDAMIERALPHFAAVWQQAMATAGRG